MPYEIKTVPKGYKVCKKHKKKCFSKNALKYDNALAQMRAIIISENKKNQKVQTKKKSKFKSKSLSKRKKIKK